MKITIEITPDELGEFQVSASQLENAIRNKLAGELTFEDEPEFEGGSGYLNSFLLDVVVRN